MVHQYQVQQYPHVRLCGKSSALPEDAPHLAGAGFQEEGQRRSLRDSPQTWVLGETRYV